MVYTIRTETDQKKNPLPSGLKEEVNKKKFLISIQSIWAEEGGVWGAGAPHKSTGGVGGGSPPTKTKVLKEEVKEKFLMKYTVDYGINHQD
jgi:hypothetical protein